MPESNTNPTTAPGEAGKRRDRFHDDFGDEGDFAGDVLRDCLVASHRFVAEIVGREAADTGFDAMIGCFYAHDVKEQGWNGALLDNDGGLYSDLVMGQVFHDLNAYAYEGIALNGGASTEDRRELLARLIGHAERFHSLVPFKPWGIEGGDLERTMLLTRGRWALDNDETIEAPALAIFGGVSEQRIRNMMSKTEKLFSNVGGRIPAKEALRWLRHKPESFRPSIWKDQETFDDLPGIAAGSLAQVFFVPVGSDGSVFHPGLMRDGRFLLGGEADDLVAEDFEAALGQLQGMVTPVWRRPTQRGLWTRVQGVRWERMTMDELQRIGEQPAPD